MSELEPLSDLARALLAEERHADVEDRSEMRARIVTHLASAVPGFATPPAAAPPAPPAAPPVPTGLSTPIAIGAGKLVAALAATFALGALTAVVVDRRVRAPEPAPVAVPAPMVRTAAPTGSAPALASASASASALAPASASAPDRKSDLARERALIDAARSGVAHGNATAALDAVRRHAEAFPNGQLSEERDALRILALAGLGRRDEAVRYDRTFRARYPQSLLRAQIDAALGTTP